jgi:hypothetical protein
MFLHLEVFPGHGMPFLKNVRFPIYSARITKGGELLDPHFIKHFRRFIQLTDQALERDVGALFHDISVSPDKCAMRPTLRIAAG